MLTRQRRPPAPVNVLLLWIVAMIVLGGGIAVVAYRGENTRTEVHRIPDQLAREQAHLATAIAEQARRDARRICLESNARWAKLRQKLVENLRSSPPEARARTLNLLDGIYNVVCPAAPPSSRDGAAALFAP